jgi:hypothetical protein
MAHGFLIAVYVISAVSEVAGIYLTVESFLRDTETEPAHGWSPEVGLGFAGPH